MRWLLGEDAGNVRLSLYFVTWFTYLLIIQYYPTEEESFRIRIPFFLSEIDFVASLLKTGARVFGFDDTRREFHMFV